MCLDVTLTNTSFKCGLFLIIVVVIVTLVGHTLIPDKITTDRIVIWDEI